MRYTLALIAAGFFLSGLAACSAPKPPQPVGDYHPINRVVETTTKNDLIDFVYEGDIAGALPALQKQAPGLTVLPPAGYASPLPVRVSVHGVTLENALRAIGEQGGDVADVVWKSGKSANGGEAFIRFHATIPSAADAASAAMAVAASAANTVGAASDTTTN